jgi:serine/threonine protein kinase
LGYYEILGLLGKGGMGEVYRGKDTKLEREVAIKVLPAVFAQHPDRLARFEREAKVLHVARASRRKARRQARGYLVVWRGAA